MKAITYCRTIIGEGNTHKEAFLDAVYQSRGMTIEVETKKETKKVYLCYKYFINKKIFIGNCSCLLYTSPSPRD